MKLWDKLYVIASESEGVFYGTIDISEFVVSKKVTEETSEGIKEMYLDQDDEVIPDDETYLKDSEAIQALKRIEKEVQKALYNKDGLFYNKL